MLALRDWAAGFHAKHSKPRTEPNAQLIHPITRKKGRLIPIGFHYPVHVVQLGYTLYRASKWAVIPDPHTLLALDPKWLEDLRTMGQLVDFNEPDPEPPKQ